MKIEVLIAKEAAGLLIRQPAKIPHVAGLYLISLVNPAVGRLGRATYFFIRYMDDLLDGDRRLPDATTPLPHVASIRSQMETGVFTDKPEIMKLGSYSLAALEKRAQPGDNPRQDFLDLIDIMVFDHQRRQKREVLTQKQLDDYYKITFSPLHNLMLIGLGSKLRAQDIIEYSLCEGRIYSVEHLEADWKAGIINIPKITLDEASLSSQSSYKEITDSSVVRTWAQNELTRSKDELLALQTVFLLSEKLTRRIYGRLTKSMMGVINDSCSAHRWYSITSNVDNQ